MADHEIRFTSELNGSGMTTAQLAKAVEDRTLTRVRRGAYAPPAELDAEAQHRRLIAASRPLLHPDAVLSHASAAVLHDLPVWAEQLSRVSVNRDRDRSGRLGSVVHVHPVVLDPSAVTVIDGMRVTDLARTTVDCLRTVPIERGVAIADAALRRGIERSALLAIVKSTPRRDGKPTARRAIDFADERAESVGESISRLVFHRAGVPTPVLQFEVIDPMTGELIARCDFGWPEYGAVGEFDGRVKYGRLLRPGESAADAVWREKRREDAVRETGLRMIRWCWDDVLEPTRLCRRMQSFLHRSTF